jgi:hypothetical protein
MREVSWTVDIRESLIETIGGERVPRQPSRNNVALGEAQYNATEHFRLCTLVKRGKGLPESDRGFLKGSGNDK